MTAETNPLTGGKVYPKLNAVRESPSKSPAAAPLPTYNSLINIGEESSIWGTLSPEREK